MITLPIAGVMIVPGPLDLTPDCLREATTEHPGLTMLPPLTDATLPTALADLTARDPRLARIVADYGPPPLWRASRASRLSSTSSWSSRYRWHRQRPRSTGC